MLEPTAAHLATCITVLRLVTSRYLRVTLVPLRCPGDKTGYESTWYYTAGRKLNVRMNYDGPAAHTSFKLIL